MEGKCFPAAFLLFLMIPYVAHLINGLSSEVHDVAVTQIIAWPNMTLPSYVRVNVTVENQGTVSETFNVTVYADNLTLTSAVATNIAPGSNETLRLTCNLFPFRDVIFLPPLWDTLDPVVVNVTIWAEASVVASEVDTVDNLYVSGTVSIIWWSPDVNGDGRINILDVAILARALYHGPYDPRWDFNRDGEVNILDLAHTAKHMYKVYYEPSNLDDP